MERPAEYDPRYLAGIVLFNRHDFFAAHEVWEDLWRDCSAADRRFYQGLIQASVALYHGFNGNWRGARRLFHSGRAYMAAYPVPYRGLDIGRLWPGIECCLAPMLGDGQPLADVRPDPVAVPQIELDPPPPSWPDPDELVHPR
jgi:uncharacterized protein